MNRISNLWFRLATGAVSLLMLSVITLGAVAAGPPPPVDTSPRQDKDGKMQPMAASINANPRYQAPQVNVPVTVYAQWQGANYSYERININWEGGIGADWDFQKCFGGCDNSSTTFTHTYYTIGDRQLVEVNLDGTAPRDYVEINVIP